MDNFGGTAVLALNAEIVDPADYAGAWYRVDDGVLYLFKDGIIECADKEIVVLEDVVFSGAYSFVRSLWLMIVE